MFTVLVTPTTGEPVTLAELKTHLRIDSTSSTAEDVMLQTYLTAARDLAENITNRQLMPATWDLVMDDFPSATASIEIPHPPMSTASTNVVITYVEDTTVGNTTTVPSTSYTVDYESEPARIFPSYDNEWPDDVKDQPKAVRIRYVAGYPLSTAVGTTVTTPEAIKIWIKMRAGMMYENREPIIEGQITNLRRDYVDGLLDPFIIKRSL